MLDFCMVILAGPLGLPYILVMVAIRLKPSLVRYWALGGVKSIKAIWNGESLTAECQHGSECKRLWLLKKSSFLPNRQNLGDTKCLENQERRL